MKRLFKKYFIPHHSNDYKPHFLRETSVGILSVIIVGLFVLSLIHSATLTHSNLFASVIPSVLVDLANQDRISKTLKPLAVSQALEDAARKKAEHMAHGGYFAHISPDGVNPWHWFGVVGYDFMYAGENLAVNFSDSNDVETAWMNSPGHRGNILNKNFTEIGIAAAKGVYRGVPTTFIVQMFGRPAHAVVSATAQGSVVQAPKSVVPSSLVRTTGPVKGAQTEEEYKLETISEDDMFIAVKNTDEAPTDEPSEGIATRAPWYAKIFASPKESFTLFYLSLAAIIVVALVLAIFIEIEHQHPRHIAYSFLLLALISVALYTQSHYIFAGVLVI